MFEDPEAKSAEKDSEIFRRPPSGPVVSPPDAATATGTASAGPVPEVLAGQKPTANAAAQVMSHWAEGVTASAGVGTAEKLGSWVPPSPEPPRIRPGIKEGHAHELGRDLAPEPPAKEGDDKKKGGPSPEMSGIATNLAIGRFVKAAKEVQKDWGKLKVEERANHLGKAANDELKAVKVTETTPVVMDIANAGQLGIATWQLKLGKKAFSAAAVTDAEAADVADTVYHESRHAEQWHRMARLQAGKKKTADEIQKSMGIPARVAQDAAKEPLEAGGAEAKEADTWWESVYGSKAKDRNTVLKNLRPLDDAVDKAQAAYDKIKSDPAVSADKKSEALKAWTGAYDKWKENIDKYHALPEEADAWKVGGKVTSAYLKK